MTTRDEEFMYSSSSIIKMIKLGGGDWVDRACSICGRDVYLYTIQTVSLEARGE